MPTDSRPAARKGRPRLTSRQEILAAARRVIDDEGWEKLTVRRVAAELGIGATTLYHHVRDREDLIVQLISEHADRMPRPTLPQHPRDRMVTAASAIHDALAALPWAADALTVDGFVGRLGGNALWLVEQILAGASASGFAPERAVEVFRTIWYYTVGEILVRTRTAHEAGVDRARLLGAGAADFGGRDPSEFPRLAAIGTAWPEIAARDTYRDGLEALIDGLIARSGTSS